MEQYRDQPAHAEKIAYQQKLLQEDVVHIRAEISQVSTVRHKLHSQIHYTNNENVVHLVLTDKVLWLLLYCWVHATTSIMLLLVENKMFTSIFSCSLLMVSATGATVSGWLWLSKWVLGETWGCKETQNAKMLTNIQNVQCCNGKRWVSIKHLQINHQITHA